RALPFEKPIGLALALAASANEIVHRRATGFQIPISTWQIIAISSPARAETTLLQSLFQCDQLLSSSAASGHTRGSSYPRASAREPRLARSASPMVRCSAG